MFDYSNIVFFKEPGDHWLLLHRCTGSYEVLEREASRIFEASRAQGWSFDLKLPGSSKITLWLITMENHHV